MIPSTVNSDHPIGLIGGAEIAPEGLNILQSLTMSFVAADSGADHLRAAGLKPIRVFGDMDSISAAARQEFAPQLVEIREQDSTDLEKVLTRVQAPVLIGAGFLGGRLDHSFSTLSVLARFRDKPLVLMSDVDCCFRLPDQGVALDLPVGTPFAVLPMDDVRVTSAGLHWDMDDMALHPARRVSSSNRTAAPHVTVQATGPAIVTLPLAHLSAVQAAVREGLRKDRLKS